MSSRRIRVSTPVLLATAALCALAAPVQAQQTDRDDDETIVVTGEREAETGYKVTNSRSGTRTDTPLIDTPQSVSVVTAKQIEDQAANSIGDAIRYTPGIFSAQGEGNRETLVIRGMTTTGDFFVDGTRDDVQTYRDLYNIQRLEVFRGPNAMAFGRGGTGGLINRVTKVADWTPVREVRFEAGMYDHYRGQIDVGGPVGNSVALRLTGVYQNSGSYRDGVEYERWGVNPTIAFRVGPNTLIQAGYEHFRDERVADRGVPSQLRPAGVAAADPLETPRGRFFGDPEQSPSWTNTDAGNLYISHDFGGGVALYNRTRYAEYEKFYQNVFTTGLNTGALTNPVGVPGGTYAPGSLVGIQGYNNLTERKNLISQTDLNAEFSTGSVKHTLLIGGEFGRQETDNIGLDGLFPTTPGGATTVTTIYAPVSSPQVSRPDVRWTVTTRGNNFGTLHIAAGYIQDQIELSPQFQIIAGVRYEHLVTRVQDRRPASLSFTRKVDDLWSPRAGLVFKPVESASIYASFSRSYLPRGGDQLTSLAPNNRSLDPERYDNYELGAKWDINPAFNVSAAVYQLDRDNVIVLIDPNNAAAGTELGGGQRSRGFEIGLAGNITPQLSVTGAYTYQEAEFIRAISASVKSGARIPNAPRHSASLWGRYDVTPEIGLALGAIHQGERFAAQDNLVRLPGYTRVDAAVFYELGDNFGLQLNVENLFAERYFVFAHSNTNITPGAPTTLRGALNIRF